VADNTPQGGTATIATDDIGGVHYQYVKPAFGPPDTATPVTATAGLPVSLVTSGSTAAPTTGTLTAAGAATLAGTASTAGAVVVDVGSAGNMSFHLLTTAFVGTVVFEQSFEPAGANGTWAVVPLLPEDGSTAPVTTLAISTAAAYIRQFTTGMFGPHLFRVRASAFTSGTLTVLASAGPGWVETQPALAPSAALIGMVDPACATAGTVTGGTTSGTANQNSVATAADTTRKGLMIWNTHASATIRLGFGTATSATLYSVLVPAGQGYEIPQAFAKLALNVGSPTATVGYNLSVCT
jgi:hypothetical protein